MLPRTIVGWHSRAILRQALPHSQRQSLQLRCYKARRRLEQNISSTQTNAKHHRNTASSQQHGVFLGTVEAGQASDHTIDEVISNIEPMVQGKPSRPNANPSLLALLVSSSFGKHALDPNLSLKVLQRFHSNPTTSKPLDAIVAVVDRLPVPGGSTSGVDGIAYAFVTDPPQTVLQSPISLQPNTTKPGALSLSITNHDVRVDAQLPLAQTVFTTGLPSTLIHIRYQFDPLTGQLRTQSSERLESARIQLPESLNKGAMSLQAPLVPLTVPRRVVSSMGNIVRKLATEDSSERMLSASQELEAAVSKYFTCRNIPPEAVQVWSLIIPSSESDAFTDPSSFMAALRRLDSAKLEALWERGAQGQPDQDDILPSLLSGARLCKVLSGGGGWGKKAGLLSLDPDARYSTRELRSDQGWEFTFEGDTAEEMLAAGRRQALGEVIREGESIVFFLATSTPGQERTSMSAANGSRISSISLGALPASTEHMQAPKGASSITHHSLHFGGLSEGGMALTITRNGKLMTQSKADAPHTRFTIGYSEQPVEGSTEDQDSRSS